MIINSFIQENTFENGICHKLPCIFKHHSIKLYWCRLPWAAMFAQESFHQMVFVIGHGQPCLFRDHSIKCRLSCAAIFVQGSFYQTVFMSFAMSSYLVCLFRDHSIKWYLCRLPWADMFVQESFHQKVFMSSAMSGHVCLGIIPSNDNYVICDEQPCLFKNHSIKRYLCCLPWADMFVQESFHQMVFMSSVISRHVCSGIIPSNDIYVVCHKPPCLFRNHSIKRYLCRLPWVVMFV